MTESGASSAVPQPPEPVCLAFEPDPLIAFLHVPSGTSSRGTAVLICPPFGWEENCSYRGRRRWAQALADAGYPAARIDLPGAGDSGGSPRDPDRIGAWCAAVAGAAGWLRDRTGCRRIAAIGIGVGGLIAYKAAAEGAAIDDLILWAVPSSGHLSIRELKTYSSVVVARHPADTRGGPMLPQGALELIGFLLDAETASALEQLRLTELQLPNASQRRVLLLGRDGLAADKRLRAHLEHAGAAVTVADTSDYGELMADPQAAQTPVETIARTLGWLEKGPPTPPTEAGGPTTPAVECDSMQLRCDGRRIAETPLRLELSGGPTFGVLSEPIDSERAPLCAVLLNAGALRHAGPNRAWVEIARRWAARGVATVRFDLLGIGDAEGDEREFVSNPALYAERSTADTLSALEQLSALGLPPRFVLAGLCSGAYWALHAALRDPRVAGALMINLYSFYWSETLVSERETFEALSALREHGWRRVVRGDVSADRLRTAVKSMRPSRIRLGARHQVERAQRDQIERDLDQLRDQGTEALLLMSYGEPLYDQFVRQGQLDDLGRWPNLTLERIPSRDHMFRALWLQQRVHASLDRALERVLARAVASRA
jgi:alpha-beta hydrolase superfamily lysophospholipase